MRNRNLIVLAIAAVVIGGYIFFFERHQDSTDERKESADKVFPNLDQEQVVAIDLSTPMVSVRLEKEGDSWHLRAPIEYQADSTAVDALLKTLVDLESERRLSEEELDPTVYGLDEPEIRVVLTAADGAVFELSVGDETPLGSNRAVMTAEPGVVLCTSFFTSSLLKELDDWRSRDVVDVTEAGVASMQLVSGEDRLHLVHVGRQWSLLEPVEDIADADHMRNMVADLNALKVVEFVDDGGDAEGLGFSTAEYALTIVRTQGDAPTVLEFGSKRDAEGATQVACRRDGRDVFWVNDTILTPLAKAPVRWRSPKVWAFDNWKVEKISITSGETAFSAARAGGVWKLSEGEADPTAIQDLLGELNGLEARSYDLMDPATAALGSVELSFQAFGEGAERETVVFSLYEALTEGGRAMVKVNTRGTVMSVNRNDLDAILIDEQTLAIKPAEADSD